MALCITLLLVFTAPAIYNQTHEAFEHHVVKGHLVHDFLNDKTRYADSPLPTPVGNNPADLIVFMHVMRTSVDTIRVHLGLLNELGLDESPPWPHELQDGARTWLTTAAVDRIRSDLSVRVVKGFFSARDLSRFQRPLRTIVFLRHPVERFLSLYEMIKVRTDDGRRLTIAEFVERAWRWTGDDGSQPTWEWGCTMANNMMAWQLGDQQHCVARTTNLSPLELMERAKQTLRNAAFVGFYETLDVDFGRLLRQHFPSRSAWDLLPLAYILGTWAARPRLMVAKYAAEVTQEELVLLRERLALDFALYDWARVEFGGPAPLYPTMTQFFLDNPIWIAQIAGTALLLLFAMVLLCTGLYRVLAQCCCLFVGLSGFRR